MVDLAQKKRIQISLTQEQIKKNYLGRQQKKA